MAALTATPAGGVPATATTEITVDTAAPRLTGASAPVWFSPNGDGQTESAAVAYTPAETCDVRVGIMKADGVVVRWLHGWRAREVRSYSITWDGKVGSGGALTAAADGLYRFDVERRDAAGNVARQGVRVVVDRTVGHPTALPATFSPGSDGVRDKTALGFKLTRKAEVTVRIISGPDVVRTLELGTLAPGARQRDVGRAGRLGRVPRQFPARLHGDRRLSDRREQREQGRLRGPLQAPLVHAGHQDDARRRHHQVDVQGDGPVQLPGGRELHHHRREGPPGGLGPARLAVHRPVTERRMEAGRARAYTVTYRAVDLGGNHEAAAARTTVTVR